MSSNSTPRPAPDNGLPHVLAFIRKLASDRFFGSVQFAFQSGHIVNIRQEQSLKVTDLPSLVAYSKGTNHDERKS
jgi:hypothetical protein